jgi:hypothetical protein
MQNDIIKGSCLCGVVSYEISGNLGIFQYCHCSRCRKFSGSAHSANLLVKPGQFRWLTGHDQVGRYEPAGTKHFATSFCHNCGSSLPWQTKSARSVVIPAGTLDSHPGIEPNQNIYYASRATWYRQASDLVKYDELPVQ